MDIVIIRSFQPNDSQQCQRIIHNATMSTVKASFWAAITREIYLQLVVVLSAFMFVFGGLPALYCLSSFILSALLIFIAIYAAHYIKSTTMTQDMLNIPRAYMSSEFTGFWVAEAITTSSAEGKFKPKFDFATIYRDSSDLKEQYRNFGGTRILVGTIAVVTSKANPTTAWLRRMAVEPAWRRRGIASALLDEALIFCRNIGYSSVELVTTECHEDARKLYVNKGFQLKQLYHKQIVPSVVQVLMYDYTLSLK